MKKLTVNDLSTLNESDQGVVFNYFGAMGGIARRRKQAFALAIFGCFAIGLSYFIDGAAAEITSEYDWVPTLQLVSKLLPAIAFPALVFTSLWGASSQQREAGGLERELATRGLDVSGLSEDDVFKHVAMPMFRRAGLNIKE